MRPPTLATHDIDGTRVDRVRVSPAQQAVLPRFLGINRPPHEGGNWRHHFALGYPVADPGLYCMVTITDQTLYAIEKYAPERREWVAKMFRGEAFGATWMTEVQGGSDLGANTTAAQSDGATWRLNGEKYFAGGGAPAFHAVDAFDRAWHERPPYSPGYHYGFLSHVAKNRTAEHAASMTATAMELFGGLGFLEEYAVSALDLTWIWEAGPDV